MERRFKKIAARKKLVGEDLRIADIKQERSMRGIMSETGFVMAIKLERILNIISRIGYFHKRYKNHVETFSDGKF